MKNPYSYNEYFKVTACLSPRVQENEDDYGACSGSVQYMPVYTLHSEKGGNLTRRKLTQVSLLPLRSPRFGSYVIPGDSLGTILDSLTFDHMIRNSVMRVQEIHGWCLGRCRGTGGPVFQVPGDVLVGLMAQ